MVLDVSRPVVSPAVPGADVVTVSVRHGLEAVDILRLRGGCGAVLQGQDTLGFLVPAGTAAECHLPSNACAASRPPEPGGDGWLLPPGARPALTDPAALRAALTEAARTLAAGAGPLGRLVAR